MAVHVLDDYYLSITALITIAYQLFFFAIAFSLKFDKLTDFAGGTNFVVLAIITLAFSGVTTARNVVASLMIMIWGVRLSGFLLFRILKTGSDDRFDDKRNDFFKFLGFWIFQMVWVFTVSLPITIINSPRVTSYPQHSFGTARDIIGIIMYAIGLAFEVVSDQQKYTFRSGNKDKNAFMSTGLFKWSRHPNYFGEILLHFGIFTLCVSPAADGYVQGGGYKALYASILGPFFLSLLLMFVSGLPLQERPTAKRRWEKGQNYEGYRQYLEKTSILIPLLPAIYKPLPKAVKTWLLLELPPYQFDPTKHTDKKEGEDAENRRQEEA